MLSITGNSAFAAESKEVAPRSTPPRVWPGFIFAAAFLISEFIILVPGFDEEAFALIFFGIVIGGSIYWLFCVHRFHKMLNEMSPNGYPFSPAEAVGKHFIPILNIIWLFQWPSQLSDYINARGRVQMISGKLIGLVLLLAVLLRFFDGAIGLACTFGITLYISAKLRRHVELLRGVSPDMLPPPPDKNLFGYSPDMQRK